MGGDVSRMDARHGDGEEEGSMMSLADLTAALRRRVRLIVAVTCVLTLASVAVALSLPPRYEGVALVQIDPRKRTIVNLEPVTSELRAESAIVDSEIEVIRSGPVMARVIGSLDLRNDPDFAAGPGVLERARAFLTRETVAPAARNVAVPAAAERDEVLAAVLASVKVTRVRTSLVIEIRASARTAAKAAELANAIADAYLAEQLDAKTRATAQATALLESRLEGLREKVSLAERRIAQFKADHAIFDAEGQLLSEKQLARIMEQTVMARNATAEAKAKLDQVRLLLRRGEGPGAISDVLANHTVRMLKDQLVHASRREAEFATRYGPLHPELIKARAEVADVSAKIAAEIGQIVAAVETEYRVARDREQQLDASLAGLKSQQVETKDALVRLRELERDASSSRQVFEAFLARFKQTTEAQGLELADARIVEQAAVPLHRAAPKRAMIVAAGFGAGLVGAIALALLIELAGGGMRRAEDVERELRLEHLASLPALRRGAGGDPMRDVRMMLAEPASAYAEAVRGLAYELELRRAPGRPAVIALMSALPNEGREAVAANLALQLALAGHSTLLVDADLRQSGLSRRLGLGGRLGLWDALARGLPVETLILRDATTGLFTLSAGSAGEDTPPASQALAGAGLRKTLSALRQRFDVIVVDAPPLLPVIDGRIIASQADLVVMVAAWRRTPKELARRAIRSLGGGAAKVVGAAISDVDPLELPRLEASLAPERGERWAGAPGRRAA